MSLTKNALRKLWFINGEEPVRYAQVPVQLLLDNRLAPRHMHIMMVLILHANRETGVCTISRETLMDYTGYNIATISKATKALSEFGWLDKSRQWSGANVYRVILPEFNAGALREIKNRRLPDDVWDARQAEVLKRQEQFRIERREQYAAELAEVGTKLIEGAVSEFDKVSTKKNPIPSLSLPGKGVLVERESVPTISPPVTSRTHGTRIPAVKPHSRVVAALREYILTKIEDPEISENDLEFYDFRWGDNPDSSSGWTIYDDVIESDENLIVHADSMDEYDVPADFT